MHLLNFDCHDGEGKKEKERLTRLFELRQAKRAQKPSDSDL